MAAIFLDARNVGQINGSAHLKQTMRGNFFAQNVKRNYKKDMLQMIVISGENPINLENMQFIAKDDAKEIDCYPFAIVYFTAKCDVLLSKKIEATLYFRNKNTRDEYLKDLWQERLNKCTA